MKQFLTILFLISCTSTKETFVQGKPSVSVTGYDFNFTIDDTVGIKLFEVQDSVNGKWQTIGTDSATRLGSYTHTLPAVPNYYRLKSVRYINNDSMVYMSKSIHVTFNTALITNTIYRTTSLNWTVAGASNISSFFLEKSIDNKVWSRTTTVSYKGNGTYKYYLARTGKAYTYRITVFFKDLTKSTPIIFTL